jgi:hypothetical protein
MNYIAAIFVASYARPAQPKRSGFQIETKNAKRLAMRAASIRQALNC